MIAKTLPKRGTVGLVMAACLALGGAAGAAEHREQPGERLQAACAAAEQPALATRAPDCPGVAKPAKPPPVDAPPGRDPPAGGLTPHLEGLTLHPEMEATVGMLHSRSVSGDTMDWSPIYDASNTYLPALGLAANAHGGVLVLGLEGEVAHELMLGRWEMILGGRAGLRLSMKEGIAFEALASAGAHAFTGVGTGVFQAPDGASAVLPYLGARVGMTSTVGDRADIGFWLVARMDTTRQHVTVVNECSFVWCQVETTTFDLGGRTFGFVIGGRLRRR